MFVYNPNVNSVIFFDGTTKLSAFFPNLELILYNLFETLRDLALFAKDLIKND